MKIERREVLKLVPSLLTLCGWRIPEKKEVAPAPVEEPEVVNTLLPLQQHMTVSGCVMGEGWSLLASPAGVQSPYSLVGTGLLPDTWDRSPKQRQRKASPARKKARRR